FVGVSAPDAPTQASVGGAVKVMCPAEGGPDARSCPNSTRKKVNQSRKTKRRRE
ncbi:hypothetical protein F442_13716, partial [Phytophthora nicotianae P10297]